MSDAAPTPDMLALWAAEQLWDWRVRMLFAAVCVVAALAALFVYLKWGRGRTGQPDGKARTYLGRISVTIFVVAAAEMGFFREPVSTMLLVATAIVIGVAALRMPRGRPE